MQNSSSLALENTQVVNTHKSRDSVGVNIIGFILSMTAGWIDAVGVKLFLNDNSAFMTGRGLSLGYWMFMWDLKAFVSIGLVVVAFITGAYLSTKISGKVGLMGSLIFTGILIVVASFPVFLNDVTIYTMLIPMAMGCQNAATSLTSINRTTHLTGPATDIGIHIAERNWQMVIFWVLRWMAFLTGSVIGFNLVSMVNNKLINISTALIIPAVIIMATGVIQRSFLNIPTLERGLCDDSKH